MLTPPHAGHNLGLAMFRWAEADNDERIEELEREVRLLSRAMLLLSIALLIAVVAIGVLGWNDWTQATTNESLAKTQSTLVTIAADQRKVDDFQDISIGRLIGTDRFQNNVLNRRQR